MQAMVIEQQAKRPSEKQEILQLQLQKTNAFDVQYSLSKLYGFNSLYATLELQVGR